MEKYPCLLCMGSNTCCHKHLSAAREALAKAFPDICFGSPMETEAIGTGFRSPFCNQLARFSTALPAQAVHDLFKTLERDSGRIPEDKQAGIVKLDIDLLTYGDMVLKPADMDREYIRRGLGGLLEL